MTDLDLQAEFTKLWQTFIWGTLAQYEQARRRYAYICFCYGQERLKD